MTGGQKKVFMNFDKETLRKRGIIWKGNHLPYNPNIVENAKKLRKNLTPEEKRLWYGYLRTFKYRVLRQRPIDNYIIDFYCPKLKLVIELDGRHHNSIKNRLYDKEREKILTAYGLQVKRFSNLDINNRFDWVCEEIERISLFSSPLRREIVEKG